MSTIQSDKEYEKHVVAVSSDIRETDAINQNNIIQPDNSATFYIRLHPCNDLGESALLLLLRGCISQFRSRKFAENCQITGLMIYVFINCSTVFHASVTKTLNIFTEIGSNIHSVHRLKNCLVGRFTKTLYSKVAPSMDCYEF